MSWWRTLIAIVACTFCYSSFASNVLHKCNGIQTCFLAANLMLESKTDLSIYTQVASLSSRMPQRFNTGGERAFVFSPRYKEWAAYDSDGYYVAGGPANGGSDYCSDLGRPCRSPVGVHRVYSKGSVECVSKKFPLGEGGAQMPFCMFFRGGYAIHGSAHIGRRNSSHGCIRVQTSAAAWLSKHFMRNGTKVIILSY